MDAKDDGGSAFPCIHSDLVGERGDYRTEIGSTGGMTLRDYFAAKVLQGMCAAPDFTIDLATGTPGLGRAQNAYMLADAMLIARRKA